MHPRGRPAGLDAVTAGRGVSPSSHRDRVSAS